MTSKAGLQSGKAAGVLHYCKAELLASGSLTHGVQFLDSPGREWSFRTSSLAAPQNRSQERYFLNCSLCSVICGSTCAATKSLPCSAWIAGPRARTLTFDRASRWNNHLLVLDAQAADAAAQKQGTSGNFAFPAPQPRQESPVPGLRASYITQSATHDLLDCRDRLDHASVAAWPEDMPWIVPLTLLESALPSYLLTWDEVSTAEVLSRAWMHGVPTCTKCSPRWSQGSGGRGQMGGAHLAEAQLRSRYKRRLVCRRCP